MSLSPTGRKADEVFRRFIVYRDRRCVRCGSPGPLECAHVMRRWHAATRCDPLNAVALCKLCHHNLDHMAGTGEAFFTAYLGADTMAELRQRSVQLVKANDWFWQDQIDNIRRLHDELEAQRAGKVDA